MAILVTGGTGYIGSHTCVELLEAGKEVVILDNFSNSKPETAGFIGDITGKEIKVYETDLLDREGVRKVFRENKIDAVIHFAGLKAVGESVTIPLRYYHNNITGTLTLLDAMAEAGCKRIVFSSSATVYGASADVPFRESHPVQSATNPYGSTKLIIETILRDLYISDNEWSVVLLRYFNPIGAHSSGLIGDNPNGIPNNLMPYIAQVAAGRLPQLNVYGDDYDTPDGTGVRDYLHVVDLAQGHVKAYDYAMAHTGAEAINLGTGRGYSVLELIKAFEDATGITIPYKVTSRRPGDIAVSFADVTKAKELLHWQVKKDIREMCADSWNFIRHESSRPA